MAGASSHYKEMENLMAPEIFMPGVKNRKFQGVDHAAHCINNASRQKPSESRRRHIIEDLGKSQYTGPSHSNIKDRRHPLRTVYPERFDQDARNRY